MHCKRIALRYTVYLSTMLALLLLPLQRHADAHAYSAAYTTMQLTTSGIEMTYTLDELSVIELAGGDVNNNQVLEPEEFDAAKAAFLVKLKQNLQLSINGETQDWLRLESFAPEQDNGKTVIALKAVYPPVAASQSVSLTDNLYLDDKVTANYVDLLTIQYGGHKSTAALSGQYRAWSMQMTKKAYEDLSEAASQTSGSQGDGSAAAGSGWYSFFRLGINHILTGYDHLLFLFSLLIARQKFKQYATMITAFTIAHSITLTLTVVGMIDISPKFVEPAIALSICFVAVDNIIRKQVSRRWVLTFLFGLIHGMGFADILKEMNIPRKELATDLISFNLGIETVQVSLVAAALPLLYMLHRWKFSRRAIIAGSSIAFMLGGIWLVERLAQG